MAALVDAGVGSPMVDASVTRSVTNQPPPFRSERLAAFWPGLGSHRKKTLGIFQGTLNAVSKRPPWRMATFVTHNANIVCAPRSRPLGRR